MNRDDADHLILTALALSIVGALGAALYGGDPIAAGVLILLGGGAWWLRRFAAAGRRRDDAYEAWRTSPETLAQFLRDAIGDGQPWEGAQSSGPSLPIMLVGPVDSVADPKYEGWSPDDAAMPTFPWGRPEEPSVDDAR